MADPVTGEEWQKLTPADQAATPILSCRGCGGTKTAMSGDPTDYFPSQHCGACPPWICDGCGKPDSMVSHCGCWTDLTTMAPADVKALFAEDGSFNVETDGRLTIPGHDHG